ncbi:uncharacterized protein LOC108737856 isoform X3 [Agrilus planipennis]|uniref:Uncharacterized protein LOC108737856 isoform X2 n=1 Tax=Agrilus planipennis TaxID=224129 RepID=A0A7F5R6J5_AGRPL|nr:uncharacterized protein LOC108737856 isoform X2 [Agrilus planipennis]XP_025831594.1 uncharacterized protein LOC108737856 isoform X3 [Agrilus planipennis]
MFKLLFTIAFLALITYCYSQIASPGQCADRTQVKAAENYDFAGYVATGRLWYTIFTYNTPGDCLYLNNTMTSNVTANFFWSVKNLTSGTWDSRSGVTTWTPSSGKRDGILTIRRSSDPSNPLVYKMLGTDRDRYSVDYRCVDVNSTSRIEILFARSRSRSFTPQSSAPVFQILEDNGLSDLAAELVYAIQDPNVCTP